MLPVIALVGRPNVGKSTLFNALTQTRDALVLDEPGVTRDRQYGTGTHGDQSFIVVDTGGMQHSDDHTIDALTQQQIEAALTEAHVLFFVVDAQAGLTTQDEQIIQQLRKRTIPLFLLVNKADRLESHLACADFYSLGVTPIAISAQSRRGIDSLLSQALPAPSEAEDDLLSDEEAGIKIAIVGRPNVGKSTLTNRLLGQERVIVLDRPGTTRDSIAIAHEHKGQRYTLIDTAGVKRAAKVQETIDKFSMLKSIETMKAADVVILLIDAQAGLTEQDLRLLGLAHDMGQALVIGFNKWDELNEDDKDLFQQEVTRRLPFVSYARQYPLSAQRGTGIKALYPAILEAYRSSTQPISTADLTEALNQAIHTHQPPLVSGRRIKLRYAHIGSHSPLTIVIHGKQVNALNKSYIRYLSHYFRKTFNLVGIPVQLKMQQDHNPYAKS